jgi:MYXO-CTERM domain-containing protein
MKTLFKGPSKGFIGLTGLIAAGALVSLLAAGATRAQDGSQDGTSGQYGSRTTTTVERDNDRPMDMGWLGLAGLAGLLGLRRPAPTVVHRDRADRDAVARP